MTPTKDAVRARIRPELDALRVDIDSITPHPDNPRDGDIGAISQSLERFGQMRPVLVQRSTGYVVAGNHTTLAAQQLGWEQIAALIMDIDDADARAYLAADNRTSDLGSYHDEQLVTLLRSIAEDTDGLLGTGYDGDDLDALISALNEGGPLQQEAGGEDVIPERYAVMVTCDSEEAQATLIGRLLEEGYECRALIS